jgi:hypothetical protein
MFLSVMELFIAAVALATIFFLASPRNSSSIRTGPLNREFPGTTSRRASGSNDETSYEIASWGGGVAGQPMTGQKRGR